MAPCPHCAGSGYFVSDYGPAPDELECADCGGTGEFDADDLGLVLIPINPGALLDAATDPSISTADYIAMVEARYPEMRDVA